MKTINLTNKTVGFKIKVGYTSVSQKLKEKVKMYIFGVF